MNDNTVLDFGQYSGTKLANVPAEWLLWYYNDSDRLNTELIDYIEDNLDVLRKEINTKKLPE